jgi:cell division protein FtsB
MTIRPIPLLLVALLLVLQAQLWFGRGSVWEVAQMRKTLSAQQELNRLSQAGNEQLANEVSDLQEGLGMVEELARHELGMVKPNEVFVQYAQNPR